MTSIEFTGDDELIARFEAMIDAAKEAARRVVIGQEAVMEAAAKRAFTEAHALGTVTPSAPGSPPAVITGTLRRSIISDAPTPFGPAGFIGRVYPSTVYARIQELGGVTGRDHATTLPARPYFRPAREKSAAAFAEIARSEFAKVLTT